MSTINGKLGLRPAGKRSMMKLPTNRAEAARITSAVCPDCQRTGQRPSKMKPGWVYCPHCNTTWELPALPPPTDVPDVEGFADAHADLHRVKR